MSTLLARRVVVGEEGGGGERESEAEWPWLEFVDADQRLTQWLLTRWPSGRLLKGWRRSGCEGRASSWWRLRWWGWCSFLDVVSGCLESGGKGSVAAGPCGEGSGLERLRCDEARVAGDG